MSRRIDARYDDPLDAVWTRAAEAIGWRIIRDDDAYASFDGKEVLTIATPAAFDPDDCLAQMILHEICHALIAGPDAASRPDYGLENADDRDLVQEHATHRLQAALADRWGLRGFFAVTTDWRPYWDRLPADPLGSGDDPAIPLARAGMQRADAWPFEAALRRALSATRAIVSAVAPHSSEDSLYRRARPAEPHPVGGLRGPSGERCAGCAWFSPGRSDPTTGTCRMHRHGTRPAPRTRADMPACITWEPTLTEPDCLRCGACCRQAFHAVPVEARSPLLTARPDWIRRDIDGFGPYLPRPDGHCVALERHAPPYTCAVYADRPRSCRDFTIGSDNCLEARRRVSLSPRPG